MRFGVSIGRCFRVECRWMIPRPSLSRVLLFLGCLVSGWSVAGAAGGRPNVLFLLADDMRADTIGAHGNPHIQTPHLDRLAAGGLRFTQFYNTARCCPTRASLLTGLYPHQAGVGHNPGIGGQNPRYVGINLAALGSQRGRDRHRRCI